MDKKPKIEVFVANTSQAHDIDYVPTVLKKELLTIKNEEKKLQKRCMYNLIYFAFFRMGIKLRVNSITKDKSGKPMMKGWFLSCSHSKDLITVAVSKNVNIGVDIEAMHLDVPFESFKKKIFHPNESRKVNVNLINVIYLWTRKEAIFKMTSKTGKFIPKNIDTAQFLTLSTTLEYKRTRYALSVAAEDNEHVHINMLDKAIKMK